MRADVEDEAWSPVPQISTSRLPWTFASVTLQQIAAGPFHILRTMSPTDVHIIKAPLPECRVNIIMALQGSSFLVGSGDPENTGPRSQYPSTGTKTVPRASIKTAELLVTFMTWSALMNPSGASASGQGGRR